MKHPLVHIVWEDSVQPSSKWAWEDELPECAPIRCQTAGFLAKEGDRSYMIAISIGDADTERPQFTGVMEIPKSCVQALTFLSCPSPRPDELPPTYLPARVRLLHHLFSGLWKRLSNPSRSAA